MQLLSKNIFNLTIINSLKNNIELRNKIEFIAIFTFVNLVFFMLLNSCANVQAPSGGPRDSTAPKILIFYPENYSTNFNPKEDKVISIEFDKYMDKGKVIENIFISPELNLEYNWSGKNLEITINDTLKSNTTYNLTMGRDITDYLGNKGAETFNLAFSSGDKIDKGSINGKLLDDYSTNLKDNKNIFIFAYFLGIDNNRLVVDSVNTKDSIFKLPDYRTQINDDGTFELKGLKQGYYAVFAVEDKLRDKSFDLGIDRIAIPQNYIYINDSLKGKCYFKMSQLMDITKPSIVSGELKNKYHLNTEKSEFMYRLVISSTELLNQKSISKLSFLIQSDNNQLDSTQSFFPVSAFLNSSDKSKIDILIDKKIDTGRVYKVIALTNQNLPQFIDVLSKEADFKHLTDFNVILKQSIISDTSNNSLMDSVNFALFKLDSNMKSSPINLKFDSSIKDSSQSVNSEFIYTLNSEFNFSDELINNETKNTIQLYNSKQVKDLSDMLIFERLGENNVTIKSSKALNLDTWYELSYKMENVFDKRYFAENITKQDSTKKEKIKNEKNNENLKNEILKIDSTISIKFKTNKSEKFSEVSGVFNDLTLDTIANSSKKTDYILKLSNKEKKVNYTLKVQNGEKWKLDKVVAGTYEIEAIKDLNTNGIYDFGVYSPYNIAEFSEPFMSLEQKIVVKENWNMEDVVIKVKF